jgi:hypothetical protein
LSPVGQVRGVDKLSKSAKEPGKRFARKRRKVLSKTDFN